MIRVQATDAAGAQIEARVTLDMLEPFQPPPPPPLPPPPPILRLALDRGPELVLSDADGGPGVGLLHVTEVDYGFPEPRAVEEPIPNADGMRDDTAYFGARVITLTGKVAIDWQARDGQPRQRQAAMDQLAPFLRPSVRPWLYSRFDDGTVKRILVRADDLSRPQIANVQDLAVSFKAPTGLFESDPENEIRMVPEVPVAGRVYNLEHNRVYPPGSGTASLVTNEGNACADWTCRIFGPCEAPAIVNVTTREAVILSGLTLGVGQFVEVSSRDRTVLADGLPESSRWHVVDFRNTTWWQLPPGTSAIRYRARWHEIPTVAFFRWRHTSLL